MTKKIDDIKKSRNKMYKEYSEMIKELREEMNALTTHMNKINELLPEAWKYQDNFLSFMETALDIENQLEVPKPEEE